MRTSFYLSSALRFILVASAILSTYSEEIRKRSLRAENVVKFDKKDDGSNHVQTTYLNSTANINSQRRRLVRITSYGGTPDASYFPLGECEGDDDCAEGLYCFQKDDFTAVPGCEGGEDDASRTDYCVRSSQGPSPTQPPQTPMPTQPSNSIPQITFPTLQPTPRPTPQPVPQPTPQPSPRPTQPPQGSGTSVQFVGNNEVPASAFPLGLCEGDCDRDSDCQGSLTCHQRGPNDPVPGCIGGEQDSSATDYCINPSTPATPAPQTPGPTQAPVTPRPTQAPITPSPTQPPAQRVPTDLVGNNGRPDSVFPLGRCQGDCDNDDECSGSLRCFQRDGGEAVPGCIGGEQDDSATDYCYDPSGSTPVTPMPTGPGQTPAPQTPRPTTPPSTMKDINRVGNDGSPSSVFPLGECEGDCDSDWECQTGLVCYQRTERYQSVPGCRGGESEREETDYCINSMLENPPGQFRLKLYWEPGYFWQDETFERRWCAAFDYDGYPCWYGRDSTDCNSNEMYMTRCRDEPNQRFTFIEAGNNEVVIRLGNGENRCWERYRRRIFLRPCDTGNPLQRWYAPNGDFNGPRFEMSQRGFDSQCVSNDHHPKEGEVVELHSCTGSRAPDSETSFWNKY